MRRRDHPGGRAASGESDAADGADGDGRRHSSPATPGGAGHHPGPPRFVAVGEPIVDPAFVDADHGFDRDNLAPALSPARDADGYDPDAFQWSVASRPAGSEAGVAYAATPYDDRPRYDDGRHDVAEFVPDEPGTYVLALEAPDGRHQLTVHAFPEPPAAHGGPPRIELEGRYDAAAGEFVLESNPRLAPDSRASSADLLVEFLAHDAAALSRADITVEGTTARVPASALDGETRVYAAPYDGDVHGTTDEAVLDPAAGAVRLPNRPPEWLEDAVVYEIFTRSFAGEAGATDFDFLASKADYLGELGVDAVWLTPVVPAWSARVEAETDDHAPGGPHGYDASDYFDVAPDLGSLEGFDRFVEACHDVGVKVCFDLAVSHCGWEHPCFQDTVAETGPEPESGWRFPEITEWDEDSMYFDWFDRMDGASGLDAAPAQTSFFGVRLQPNLNYGSLALRRHVLAAAAFWADRVDAVRCDIAWGVPHSVWKEVRELVTATDAEFALLDETVPNDPSFAASEFDVHVDTVDFMRTAHDVARGEADPDELVAAVRERRREGFPDHTHLVNATENHDEPRVYWEARENGRRADPARAQRAAAAAAFALPGVPVVYYGQERLLTEHGHRRTSPFEGDPDRDDDISRHPYKRGFMNWADEGDTVPQNHLAFYEDLVAFYHESPVLSASGEVVDAVYRTDAEGDVLGFGLATDDGKRVVLVNFGPDPATVRLRDAVSTVDRFSGRDVGVDAGGDGTRVAVDTLAVLPTPSLSGADDETAADAER